jgi:NADPH-dependent glutamate synthase beta subunit-like oxidoreductase
MQATDFGLAGTAVALGAAGKGNRRPWESSPEPSDEETPMPDRVLIVGAGPTGLTAALELSRLGIPVRIIDKPKKSRKKGRRSNWVADGHLGA